MAAAEKPLKKAQKNDMSLKQTALARRLRLDARHSASRTGSSTPCALQRTFAMTLWS